MSHTKEGFDAYVILTPFLSYISTLFLRRNGSFESLNNLITQPQTPKVFGLSTTSYSLLSYSAKISKTHR